MKLYLCDVIKQLYISIASMLSHQKLYLCNAIKQLHLSIPSVTKILCERSYTYAGLFLVYVVNHGLQMMVEGCNPGRSTAFVTASFITCFLNVRSHVIN